MVVTRSAAQSRSRSASVELVDPNTAPESSIEDSSLVRRSKRRVSKAEESSEVTAEPEASSSKDDESHPAVRTPKLRRAGTSESSKSTPSTPIRRSRRLASEEPEEVSGATIPAELAGGRRQRSRPSSFTEDSDNERNLKKGKERNSGSGHLAKSIIAVPQVERIEEVEEQTDSSYSADQTSRDIQVSKAGNQLEAGSNDKIEFKSLTGSDSIDTDKKHTDAVEIGNIEVEQLHNDLLVAECEAVNTEIEAQKNKQLMPAECDVEKEPELAESSSSMVYLESKESAKPDEKIPEVALSVDHNIEPEADAQIVVLTKHQKQSSAVQKGETVADDTNVRHSLEKKSSKALKGKKKKAEEFDDVQVESPRPVAATETMKHPLMEERNELNFEKECFPIWSEAELVQHRRHDGQASFLFDCLSKGYALITSLNQDSQVASEPLVTLNEEVVWQQLASQNKRLNKAFRKLKDFIEVPLPELSEESEDYRSSTLHFEGENEDEPVDHDADTSDLEGSVVAEEDSENEGEEESSSALFNLNEEDLKTLEKELDELDDESDAAEIAASHDNFEGKAEKKYRKTIVDDKFFSLAEMEEFLDQEDKKDSSKGFFDQVSDDKEDEAADYRYTEFYGRSDYEKRKEASKKSVGLKKTEEKKKRKERTQEEEFIGPVRKKKKVRFASEVLSDEELDEIEDEEALGKDTEERVLLGPADDDAAKKETEFQKRQKKLKAKMAALEEENLAPRSWEMSGEVTAVDREENSMLEKHIDYDHARKLAPVITVDRTEKLEAMIIQRIKDKAYDDVERKVRDPETARGYRAHVEEEVTKKSLAEVYEEQYQKAQNPELTEKKQDERKVEIEKRMSELFRKLDALFHFKSNPPEIRPEVRVVNNMASLRKEEVGPLASTEEMLVAPEEVKRHEKGEIKGAEERTDADRARERRKKKKLQRLMARQKKREEFGESDGKKKARASKKPNSAAESSNVKSTAFFKQLQETAANEVKNKSKKLKEKKNASEGKINASAKYIL